MLAGKFELEIMIPVNQVDAKSKPYGWHEV